MSLFSVSIVIIPSPNTENLKKNFEGIVNQSLKDIEIVLLYSNKSLIRNLPDCIIDDGRVRKVKTKGNFYQDIFKKCQGEYIFFTRLDDSLDVDALYNFYRKSKRENLDLCICAFSTASKDNCLITDGIRENLFPEIYTPFMHKDCLGCLFNLTYPYIFNKFFKRQFVLDHNLSDYDFGIHTYEFITAMSFLFAERISAIKIPLLYYNPNLEKLNSEEITSDLDSMLSKMKFLIQQVIDIKFLEKTFINYILELGGCFAFYKEPGCSLYIDYFINKIFKEHNILQYDNSFFYNKSLYQKFIHFDLKKNLFKRFKNICLSKRNSIIPIVLTANSIQEFYNVTVLISSIIDYAQDSYFYDIYLFHTFSSNELTTILTEMSTDNIRVTCILWNNLLKNNVIKAKGTSHFGVLDCFSNLSYERIVFLYNHCLLKQDLSKLYRIDIGNAIVAGVRGYEAADYVENKLGLISETYISADVLVIDANRFEEVIPMLLRQLDDSMSYQYKFQDIINIVLQNNIYVIEDSWNIQQPLLTDDNFLMYNSYLLNNIFILNYTKNYPWLEPGIKYGQLWWYYARKTPIYEKIIIDNIKKKMIAQTTEKKGSLQKSTIKSTVKISELQNPFKGLDIYDLRVEFIKEFLLYFFSFFKRRRIHKAKLIKLVNQINCIGQKDAP